MIPWELVAYPLGCANTLCKPLANNIASTHQYARRLVRLRVLW